jgi:hypothetical protein
MPALGMPGDYMVEYKRLNVRVKPDDQFCRFDECAILNFIRLLKMRIQLLDDRVEFDAPIWKSFWIEGRQRFEDDKEGWAETGRAVSEMLARYGRTD